MRWVSAWRWLSGPCPFPMGNAVSMPTCVNEVAWRVASTTTNCESMHAVKVSPNTHAKIPWQVRK